MQRVVAANNGGSLGHIDALRGLAIFLVVMLHVGVMTPGLDSYRYLYAIVARLNVGMQLFFVLSGYLICASWDRAQNGPHALATFAIKRIGKIVPLYLFFLHLNLAIFFISHGNTASVEPSFSTMDTSSVGLSNYVLHLFFLQGFVPVWLNSLVDGSWSIIAEVYFYLLYPLILHRFCKTILAAFRTYLVVLSFAILTGPIFSLYTIGNFGYYNFLYQLPCFMVGVVACRVINQSTALTTLRLWSRTLLAFAAIASVGLLVGNVRPMGVSNLYAILFGVVLVAIYYVPERELWVDRLALMIRIGRQSYAIFFTHLLLLWGLRKIPALNFDSLNILTAFCLNLAVGLFGSLFFSYLLVHRIDQYFVRISTAIAERIRMSALMSKSTF